MNLLKTIAELLPSKEIKIFSRHGKQFVPNLQTVELTPLFRGRPVISNGLSDEAKDALVELCPLEAISKSPFGIDLGKCNFCKECAFAFPEKIKFINDYKIATNVRENLFISEGEDKPIEINKSLIRKEIATFFKNSLKLRHVAAGGDMASDMEMNAIGNVNFDIGRYGIEFVASPRHADGILITGPISQNMAEALQICYDAVPSPKLIILAGTDAICSGIYKGSKALGRSFLEKYPIDLYLPGNPPHPLTIINGLLGLTRKDW
ncbi:MAG TPA: NADH:ubiquinone oxidoreductase [Candidatus Kapabacteria bacterium]|nr:NADH:ubiquinone oxidoreductase [Candidatus Kapabacteria bacterium]